MVPLQADRSCAVLDRLASADSAQNCATLLLEVAQNLGFSLVSLTPHIGDPQQQSIEAKAHSGTCLANGFLRDWHQRHYRTLNPTNAISRQHAQPFSWGRCADDWSVCVSLDRQQRKVLDHLFDQGIAGAVGGGRWN